MPLVQGTIAGVVVCVEFGLVDVDVDRGVPVGV